jgi:hypothetical protein
MKDYLDLSVMLERETLDAETLARAISATFARRGTVLPNAQPVGLSDEFAGDPSRQAMWLAFLGKNELRPEPLSVVVERLRTALMPVLDDVRRLAAADNVSAR